MNYKIVFHTPEYNACSYYRNILPVMQCYSDMSKKGIQLILSEKLSINEKINTYVVSRIIKPNFFSFLYNAKCNGAKIIWASDDDVFNIPYWNPFSEKVSEDDIRITLDLIKISDALFVSTQKLKESLSSYNNSIYVLPNLVDLCCFNYKDNYKLSNSKFKYNIEKPIEILWAGSATHDEDLCQMVNPVLRLIDKYKDKIHFTFMGYLPTELSEFVRFAGRNVAYIKSKYDKNISYITDVPLKQYYDTLFNFAPDIGIAPLCDCPFNESKSAIKSYEMLLSGAAFIGTKFYPYDWVEHNKHGLLVNINDQDGWFNAISELIEDKTKRNRLLETGKEEVIKNHTWQSPKKNIWLDAFENVINI